MIGIVDTFREKKFQLDAVIYLGTGFCPRGWNTPQPSFDFNPEVFRRQPEAVLADLHKRNVRVVLPALFADHSDHTEEPGSPPCPGAGLQDMGPGEDNNRNTPAPDTEKRNPRPSELNNPLIEVITRKYAELRYQLLPYTYTLAWEAHATGMPLMRAMWLHYPNDKIKRQNVNSLLNCIRLAQNKK